MTAVSPGFHDGRAHEISPMRFGNGRLEGVDSASIRHMYTLQNAQPLFRDRPGLLRSGVRYGARVTSGATSSSGTVTFCHGDIEALKQYQVSLKARKRKRAPSSNTISS
jgi:hypothetical protein